MGVSSSCGKKPLPSGNLERRRQATETASILCLGLVLMVTTFVNIKWREGLVANWQSHVANWIILSRKYTRNEINQSSPLYGIFFLDWGLILTRDYKLSSQLDTAQNHWKRSLFPAITSSLLFREGLRVSDRNTLEQVLCQYILLFLIRANGKPKYKLSNYLWYFPTYWKSIITDLRASLMGLYRLCTKKY